MRCSSVWLRLYKGDGNNLDLRTGFCWEYKTSDNFNIVFTSNKHPSHWRKKNRGQRNQYRRRNDHEAIISPVDFVAVQRKISNAKYGGTGIPELRVIPDGALKGFVTISPRWASFTAEDYLRASAQIPTTEEAEADKVPIQVQTGDPDLRGFEIARTQFFGSSRKVRATFSMEHIVFSIDALQKLGNPEYVELLVHPKKRLFAVRKCNKDRRTAVKWATGVTGKMTPKPLGCAAYISTLFELFGWNRDYRYRAGGVRRQRGEETVLIFDLTETEVLIPVDLLEEFRQKNDITNLEFSPLHLPGHKQTILAYPQSWADSFGREYYRQTQTSVISGMEQDEMWHPASTEKSYTGSEPQSSPPEQLEMHLSQLIRDFREENA